MSSSTGGYHHAIILSPAVYARPCYADNISNDSAYWKHEDAARHLSNHVMNKYPNLNVLCLNNSNYMKHDLWSDPTRINACLFSQASRIVLFIPDDATEHITHFSRHCLQPLLCRSRDQGGRPEWHSRFIAVAIGSVQVPNQLNSDVPFINVIRFREIGWFRDIMGMMLLERAIKDFWIPSEMKEFTSQQSDLKQSNLLSIKYSLNEIIETTSFVDITTHVVGKMNFNEIHKNSHSQLKSPLVKKSIHDDISNDNNTKNDSVNHNHSSKLDEDNRLQSIRRHIKPEFEAEQLQENILEARLIGTIGQVIPVNIKKDSLNTADLSTETNEHDKIDIKTKTSTSTLELNVNEINSPLDINNTSITTLKTNENSIITTNTNLSDNFSTLPNATSLISSTISNISPNPINVAPDLKTATISIVQTIDDKLKQNLNYKNIPMIDEEAAYEVNPITTVPEPAAVSTVPMNTPKITISTTPLVITSSTCGKSNNAIRTKMHKITREETITSQSETMTTTTNSINRIICSSSSSSNSTVIVDNKFKRSHTNNHNNDNNNVDDDDDHDHLTQPKQTKNSNLSSKSHTIPVQSDENDKQKTRSSSFSPTKKPIRIIPVNRKKFVETKSQETTDIINKPNNGGCIKTITISTEPKIINQNNTKSRSSSTSRYMVRKCLRSGVGSPSRSSRSPTKSTSPCHQRIVKIYATQPFSKLQNMLSDSSTQIISPLATGVFTNDGITCYGLCGLQYRQKTISTTTNDNSSTKNNDKNNNDNDDDQNDMGSIDNNNNNHSNNNNNNTNTNNNNHTTNLHTKPSTSLSVSREMNNWTGPDSAETYRLELLLANKLITTDADDNEKLWF
ncbi:unnamed protein product [Schistosoma turkestanicum]|nr:unnamed protein product [Schistosoma turkestanicum]